MPDDEVLLDVRNVRIRYEKAVAVDNVSLQVRSGELVTLLGANGAGKTTILRAISGLKTPSGGIIRFGGVPMDRWSAAKIARLGISHVPEGRRVFGRLSIRDNLELGGYYLDWSELEKRIEDMYEMFPILRKRSSQQASTLSGGEQQMLAISRALIARPRLLLLDEPSLGLAPIVVQALFARLQEILARGVSILLVEQNARLALATAHRAYVLERGNVVCSGTSEEVRRNDKVLQAYLGGSAAEAIS
jgi:branched-chain amino acid transport system ATP-binding protein